MPLHVSSTCPHHQEVKIALHSLWYHHTETSEWSKITKIQFYKYEQPPRHNDKHQFYTRVKNLTNVSLNKEEMQLQQHQHTN